MKFTTYQAAVEPNTMHPPAVRMSSDVNAYGSGGEEYGKLGAAIGQVNKVLAQRRDDLDAADVMKARNEIMTSLTQQLYGENGLFVTGVGENAKGLMGRTTDAINQTYDDVSKHHNDRVKYALKGNLNENMANFQRIAASKEMAEGNEVRKETFASNLATNAQQAALTWQVKGAPTMYVKNGDTLLQVRAKQEGWSGAQLTEERRKMVTDVAAAAAGAALENEDYDRADEILNQFRPDMDQQTYWKLARVGKQKQQAKEMDTEADEILKMPGVFDGKTLNLAKAGEYVNARYGRGVTKEAAGVSPADVERGFAGILGQEMANKRDGCVEAYLKGTGQLSGFCAREAEKGVVYVPTLLRDARADDSVVVEPYTLGMDIPAGAAIIYSPPGADMSDPENAHHVLASDGKGGVFGNSSSAADYTDENGNYIRGNGKVTHGDSVEIGGGLVPALIIRPKDGGRVSAYDPEKRDRLMKLIEAKGGDMQKAYQQQRRQYLDGVMQAAQSAGSYSAALSMLNGQDLSMDERVSIERTIGQYYHVGGSSGGGRAGGGRSGREYNPSKDIEIMKKMDARIATGTKISSDQFVAYKSAALRLDNSGLLGDEYQELQNNPEVWSQITDDIETGGLDKAMKRLISCGVDPVTACALLAKSDVSTALTNDFEDEDEESRDEYQGTD